MLNDADWLLNEATVEADWQAALVAFDPFARDPRVGALTLADCRRLSGTAADAHEADE